MELLDKVAEAYYGGMGDRFARKTRERIHWICSKVQGKRVLDVGCSQGIVEIILGKEGRQIVGIDIEGESVAYAKNAILNESDAVKNNVEYRACSIFEFETEHQFETVILAEVMEHFSSSILLLERVTELLIPNGTLIVTVPFGINDFIDHKKTYYLLNLLEEVEPYFKVTEVKFFGKWLGLVMHKEVSQQERSNLLSRELVKQLEDSFYIVERALVDSEGIITNQIKKLNNQLAENQTIISQLRQDNMQLKSKNEDTAAQIELLKYKHDDLNLQLAENQTINNQLRLEIEQLKSINEDNKAQFGQLKHAPAKTGSKKEQDMSISVEESEIEKYKQKIVELEQTIESKNKEILDRLDSEENTLKHYKDTIFEYNQLDAKYSNVSKKYDLLSKAKLGRLTLKYWKFRKRIPEEF